MSNRSNAWGKHEDAILAPYLRVCVKAATMVQILDQLPGRTRGGIANRLTKLRARVGIQMLAGGSIQHIVIPPPEPPPRSADTVVRRCVACRRTGEMLRFMFRCGDCHVNATLLNDACEPVFHGVVR